MLYKFTGFRNFFFNFEFTGLVELLELEKKILFTSNNEFKIFNWTTFCFYIYPVNSKFTHDSSLSFHPSSNFKYTTRKKILFLHPANNFKIHNMTIICLLLWVALMFWINSLSVLVGSRESAFVYAISSAGVVHSITRACSKGNLLQCGCDPTKAGKGRDKAGWFEWGGCSDNVRWASHFSRMFIDARERRVRDARALMNLHNNRAGRRVSNMKYSTIHIMNIHR